MNKENVIYTQIENYSIIQKDVIKAGEGHEEGGFKKSWLMGTRL